MTDPQSGEPGTTWVISTGDPAGSSPELLPALLEARRSNERLLLVGPENVADRLKLQLPRGNNRPPGKAAAYWWTSAPVKPEIIASGQPNAASGKAALEALRAAVKLVDLTGADGLLTLPLSKAAVQAAGQEGFTGHTEFLENHWETPGVMSFFGDRFNTALLTRHIPLERVSSTLSIEKIVGRVKLVDRFFRKYEQKKPALALLGLNPHAGEAGLLGTEEIRLLKPAVKRLQNFKINITGPHPSDSFMAVASEEIDCFIACYHDQALTPFKLVSFFTGIQATLGLPVLRVSPDHGVAADLAGTGKIDCRSSLNCLKWLRRWHRPRKR